MNISLARRSCSSAAALPIRAGALADLAAEHRARWLAAVLPHGPCMVVAGGAALASTLAADSRRAIVLVEHNAARVEVASRVVAPGVRKRSLYRTPGPVPFPPPRPLPPTLARAISRPFDGVLAAHENGCFPAKTGVFMRFSKR